MWQARIELLDDGRTQKLGVIGDDAPVSYSDVLDLWRNDIGFRRFFIGLLAASPFTAFRWETPVLSSANINRDFEFVLLDSKGLERPVDEAAFAGHFSDENDVVTFSNLGGDAVLVVPCPIAATSIYGHLASFIRNAPDTQVHQLWQSVGDAMQRRVGEQPVWLSTAGMGVSWLHVRLDSRPKYYGYSPYKQSP